MNYSRNMPEWHQYNPSQSGISDITANAQNVNTNHYGFVPSIGRSTINGHDVVPEGIEKHQNDKNYGSRYYQTLGSISNNPNINNNNNLLPSMAQMSACIGHNTSPNTRNTISDNISGSVNSRSGSIGILNEDLGYRNNQIPLNTPVPHLSGPNHNINGPNTPLGPRNSVVAPLPNNRQGPPSFIPCKGLCCNPDPNVNYQHWEKYGHYQANVAYRDNVRSGYQMDNRRFSNDSNFRKESYEGKEVMSPILSNVEHQRSYSEYKHHKESVAPRTYPTSSGMLQNYPPQNYNFTGDYQKYSYPVKDYTKVNNMNLQPPEMLKHPEQNFINQQKFNNKPIQYQNESILPKGLQPNNISANMMLPAQNSYYNSQYGRGLHIEYPRDCQEPSDSSSLMNRVPSNTVQNNLSRYQMYQQKIAMQRYSMENHLRELTRIPGYQTHPKYKECVLKYRELLKLQQPMNYQNNMQQNTRIATPVITNVPPINLQFDQNGTLINSNYLTDNYSRLQHILTTESIMENSKKHATNSSMNLPELEHHNMRQQEKMINSPQIEHTLPMYDKSLQNQERYAMQTHVNQGMLPNQKIIESNNYGSPTSDNADPAIQQNISKEFADKPELDVRQFLANWDESEEEDTSNSNVANIVLSESTPVVILGYENLEIPEKTTEGNRNSDKERISVLATEGSLGIQYSTSEEAKPAEGENTENVVKAGRIIHCISSGPDEVPTIHIIDNLEVDDNALKNAEKTIPVEIEKVYQEKTPDENTSKARTETSSPKNSTETTSKKNNTSSNVAGHTSKQATEQSLNVLSLPTKLKANLSDNLKKQTSFTSEESHNPDDISLPDLPTSECTPISTTLNTPIHSDSEESSEQVDGLTTSTNPIEVIQNSPIISFTHSPVRIEPYEYLGSQENSKDKSNDSLQFDFQQENQSSEITKGTSNSNSYELISETSKNENVKEKETIKHEKEESSLKLHSIDFDESSTEEKNIDDSLPKEAVILASVKHSHSMSNKSPKIRIDEHSSSKVTASVSQKSNNTNSNETTASKLRIDESGCLDAAESMICDSNQHDLDISENMIPLIPGDETEEPKMPVSPMEENCLTKVMKNTMPITNLNVIDSDDEKLDKEDDPWIEVRCDDKLFNMISNPGSPKVGTEMKESSVSDILQQPKSYFKSFEQTRMSDGATCQTILDDCSNSSIPDACIEKNNSNNSGSNARDVEENEKNTDNENSKKNTSASQMKIFQSLNPKNAAKKTTESRRDNVSQSSILPSMSSSDNLCAPVDDFVTLENSHKEKSISQSVSSKSVKPDLEIQVANVNFKIKDNDVRREIISVRDRSEDETKSLVDAIKIEINVSRSDVVQRRLSVTSATEENVEEVNLTSVVRRKSINKENENLDVSVAKNSSRYRKSSLENYPNDNEDFGIERDDYRERGTVDDAPKARRDVSIDTIDSSKNDKVPIRMENIETAMKERLDESRREPIFDASHIESVITHDNSEPLRLNRSENCRKFERDKKCSDPTNSYDVLASRYGSIIENKIETTIEPLSKRINMHKTESKDSKTFPDKTIRKYKDDNSLAETRSDFGDRKSILDFDHFDVEANEDSSFETTEKWNRTRGDSIEASYDFRRSSRGFANPLFSSIDELEDLNTVPVYTTKDGKIKYSPNPRYTYRELIREARLEESRCRGSYKRTRDSVDGSCRRGEAYGRHPRASDRAPSALDCRSSGRFIYRSHFLDDSDDNVDKNKKYGSDFVTAERKRRFDESKNFGRVASRRVDSAKYYSKKIEISLSPTGLFLENKSSYRDDTMESMPGAFVNSQRNVLGNDEGWFAEEPSSSRAYRRFDENENVDSRTLVENAELSYMENLERGIDEIEKSIERSMDSEKTNSKNRGDDFEMSDLISRNPSIDEVELLRKSSFLEARVGTREDSSKEEAKYEPEELICPTREKSLSPPKLSLEVNIDDSCREEIKSSSVEPRREEVEEASVEKEPDVDSTLKIDSMEANSRHDWEAIGTTKSIDADEIPALDLATATDSSFEGKKENSEPPLEEEKLENETKDFSPEPPDLSLDPSGVTSDLEVCKNFDESGCFETENAKEVSVDENIDTDSAALDFRSSICDSNSTKIEHSSSQPDDNDLGNNEDSSLRCYSRIVDSAKISEISENSSEPNLKSVPKLVIKRSESNAKLVSKSDESSDNPSTEDPADKSNINLKITLHPKIPKMIIRNVKSRPETPTVEEIPDVDSYVKYSKVDQNMFKIDKKSNSEDSQGSVLESRSQENRIPKMILKLEDGRSRRVGKSDSRETYHVRKNAMGTVPKVKIRRSDIDFASSKIEASSDYEDGIYRSSVSGRCRKDKTLRLKLRKQNSSRSSSPSETSRKRPSSNSPEASTKRSKKSSWDESRTSKQESRNDGKSSVCVSEKIPKVIIKRSSASAEFKCEISKDRENALSKDVKWQPEVKLERSKTLDRMVKTLKNSKLVLTDEVLKKLNLMSAGQDVAETARKRCKLFRSSSTSDLSPTKHKQRRLSDYQHGRARDSRDCEWSEKKTRRFECSSLERPSFKRIEERCDVTETLKSSHESSSRSPKDLAKIENDKDIEIDEKIENSFASEIEEPNAKEESVDYVETEDQGHSKSDSFADNVDSNDTSVIKVDSSDESQTTIELLPASPADLRNELGMDDCNLENDYGPIYSADAIPTQFELELDITDNSTADPLEVPMPMNFETSSYSSSKKAHEHEFDAKSRKAASTCDVDEFSKTLKTFQGSDRESSRNISFLGKIRRSNSDTSFVLGDDNRDGFRQRRKTSNEASTCCNDLLVREVLAAKETLRKCLPKSDSGLAKSASRPLTAAEKKQGMSYYPEESDPSTDVKNAKNVNDDCKTDIKPNIRKSEKRHSKYDVYSCKSKKIRAVLPNETEMESRSVDDPGSPSSHGTSTISLKSVQRNRARVTSSSLESSELSDCRNVVESAKTLDADSKQEARKHKSCVSEQSKETKVHYRAKTQRLSTSQISRVREEDTNARGRKRKEDNMPVLEPEIGLNFDDDRNNSRSPPVITNQNDAEIRTAANTEAIKEEKINPSEHEEIYKVGDNEKGEMTVSDVITQLAFHEKATIKHRRYCVLCERWFPTTARHRRHLTGYQHRHAELVQRKTVHALFMLFTGKPCPRLLPANVARSDCAPGELTPLQIAVQDVTACFEDTQRNLKKQNDIN